MNEHGVFGNGFLFPQRRGALTRVNEGRKAPKKWKLNAFGDGRIGVGEFVCNFRANWDLDLFPIHILSNLHIDI